MKKYLQSATITVGLAIFAMLFGSGNLMYPVQMGALSGSEVGMGLLGFVLSGVLLPILSLISITFFDGNYQEFFRRIGNIPGAALIFICMLIIGPLFIMPRIIDLIYDIAIHPNIGHIVSLLSFSILFGLLVFMCCYKRSSLVDLLGKILSPLKLITLFAVIIIGFITGGTPEIFSKTSWEVFINSFEIGYYTLDLLGTIFFGYIIISIMRSKLDVHTAGDQKKLASIMFKGSMIGGLLIATVYAGLAILGALHGQGLDPQLNKAQVFYAVTKHALGHYGSLFIGITVFLACLSTMIALASVVSEYLRNDIFKGKVNYTLLLILVLMAAVGMAQFKLGSLENFAGPIIMIIYPVLIVLTFCNLAYKLFGFTPVKIPVLITFLISGYIYMPGLIANFQNPEIAKQAAAKPAEPSESAPAQEAAADMPLPENATPEPLIPN